MTQVELVFLPSSGIGHMVPTIELAKLIIQSNPNIFIHVIVYYMTNESNSTLAYFEYLSKLELDRITFVILPRLENPPDPSSPLFVPTVIQLHKPLIKQAILDRQLNPAGIVTDMTNVSMTDVAQELNVPFYIFFTSGPCYLNTLFQFQVLADEVLGYDGITELVSNPNAELDLNGFHARVPAKILPVMFLRECGLPWAMISLARKFREAKGILLNTFVELEPFTIEALQEQVNVPKVYPVGPILALPEHDDLKHFDNVVDEDSIMNWLDKQPLSSVVFLCPGSTGCFEVSQVKEIANGLDRSGYRFLWVLRMPTHIDVKGTLLSEHDTFTNALPEGFLEKILHKGKIVSWAPQMKVLAHQAIGGFVSHCGWNSTLESIWFGVPIATWPLHSEQQLNAFTLVKELGLAIDIRLDYRYDFKKQKGNFLVMADEVEKSIKTLMNPSTSNDKLRSKLHEMSRISREALHPDGSSNEYLSQFIEGFNDYLK